MRTNISNETDKVMLNVTSYCCSRAVKIQKCTSTGKSYLECRGCRASTSGVGYVTLTELPEFECSELKGAGK